MKKIPHRSKFIALAIIGLAALLPAFSTKAQTVSGTQLAPATDYHNAVTGTWGLENEFSDRKRVAFTGLTPGETLTIVTTYTDPQGGYHIFTNPLVTSDVDLTHVIYRNQFGGYDGFYLYRPDGPGGRPPPEPIMQHRVLKRR